MMIRKKPKPSLLVPRKEVTETVLELKTDFPTALNRLRQLTGVFRDAEAKGHRLVFCVNRRGRISVDDAEVDGTRISPRSVFLSGGLYIEEGKTKAVVYTYSSAIAHAGNVLFLSILILGTLLAVAVALINAPSAPLGWGAAGVGAFAAVATILGWLARLDRTVSDADMVARCVHEETIRRLSAIDEWDK